MPSHLTSPRAAHSIPLPARRGSGELRRRTDTRCLGAGCAAQEHRGEGARRISNSLGPAVSVAPCLHNRCPRRPGREGWRAEPHPKREGPAYLGARRVGGEPLTKNSRLTSDRLQFSRVTRGEERVVSRMKYHIFVAAVDDWTARGAPRHSPYLRRSNHLIQLAWRRSYWSVSCLREMNVHEGTVMEKGVIIVNKTHGTVMDMQAVADACKSGHIPGLVPAASTEGPPVAMHAQKYHDACCAPWLKTQPVVDEVQGRCDARA